MQDEQKNRKGLEHSGCIEDWLDGIDQAREALPPS